MRKKICGNLGTCCYCPIQASPCPVYWPTSNINYVLSQALLLALWNTKQWRLECWAHQRKSTIIPCDSIDLSPHLPILIIYSSCRRARVLHLQCFRCYHERHFNHKHNESFLRHTNIKDTCNIELHMQYKKPYMHMYMYMYVGVLNGKCVSIHVESVFVFKTLIIIPLSQPTATLNQHRHHSYTKYNRLKPGKPLV